jgi:Tol biopolymer transport system component
MAWAPDMSRFAVAGWSDGMIHLVEGERVTSYPVGLEVLPSNLWWSGDGEEVFYTSPERARRDRSKSTVMALDPSDGSTRPVFEPVEGLQGVHIAPDGRRMVFRVEEDGVPQRLVVSDLGSTEGRTIATSGDKGMLNRQFGQPLFSPSGEHVIFMRNDEDWSSMSLWVVASDGTNERKLAEAGGMTAPQWDPTGRMIAFSSGYPGATLSIVEVATGAVHEIEGFSELGYWWLMDWSSDGAWLGVRETIGRSELWRISDVLGEGG